MTVSDKLKMIYDKYGEEGLRKGIPNVFTGYSFKGNAIEFADKLHQNRFLLEDEPINAAPRDESLDFTVEVQCELKEFLGCLKTIKFSRFEIQKDNRTVEEKAVEKVVEIKAGSGNQPLIFRGEGHQKIGYLNGDLKVVFKTATFGNFRRHGDNLIYTHKISLEKALTSTEQINLETIDNKIILIALDEVITPTSAIIREGEGMPILGGEGKKGDLIIKFDIQFPKYLTEAEKDKLETVLIE